MSQHLNHKKTLKNKTDHYQSQDESYNQKLRIIQPNIVFANSLPSQFSQKQLLQTQNYFGRYGQVNKIIVNPSTPLKKGITYQAYVTYKTQLQASLAIVALDGFKLYSDKPLKVSFGTTKYCTNFLKGYECQNNQCFYLHKIDKKREVLNGDSKSTNALFKQQNLTALQVVHNNLEEVIKLSLKQNVNLEQDELQGFPTLTQMLQFLVQSHILTLIEVQALKNKIINKQKEQLKNDKKNKIKQINETKFDTPTKKEDLKDNKKQQDKNQISQKSKESDQPKLVKSNSFSTTCSPTKTEVMTMDSIQFGKIQEVQLQICMKQQNRQKLVLQSQNVKIQQNILIEQKIQKLLLKQVNKIHKEYKSRFSFAVNNNTYDKQKKRNLCKNQLKNLKNIIQTLLIGKN